MPPHHLMHHPCNKLLLLPLLIVTAISVAAYVNFLPTESMAVPLTDVVVRDTENALHKRMMRNDVEIASSRGQPRGGQGDWRGNVEYSLAVNTNTLPPHIQEQLMRAVANRRTGALPPTRPQLSLQAAAHQDAMNYMTMTSARPPTRNPRIEDVTAMSDELQREYERASTSRPPRLPSRWYSRERARLHRKMALHHLSRSFSSLGRHVVAGFRGASKMQNAQRHLESMPVRSSPHLRAITRAQTTFPCWQRVKGLLYGACEAGREAGKSITHLSKSAEYSAKWGLGRIGQNRPPSATYTRVPGPQQQNAWLMQLHRNRERQRLERLRAERARIRAGRPSEREQARLAQLSSPQLLLPALDPPRVEYETAPRGGEEGHVIIADEDEDNAVSDQTPTSRPRPAESSSGTASRHSEASEHRPAAQSQEQSRPVRTAPSSAQPRQKLRTAAAGPTMSIPSQSKTGSSSRAPRAAISSAEQDASEARSRAVKAAIRRAKKQLAEQKRRRE